MSTKPSKNDTVIYLDIETLPAEEEDPLWQHFALKNGLPKEEQDEVRRRTSLWPALGRPWMIGFAVGPGDPIICWGEGTPASEKQVLEEFWAHVRGYNNPWFVGHNIRRFDLPFLQVRALKNGMPALAKFLGSPLQKPWEKRILDTQELWPDQSRGYPKGFGLKKLDTICRLLDLSVQEGVMGEGVYQAYLEGNAKGVYEHLYEDVLQVRDVFRVLFPAL
jgi:uncharacterized protein YprB with RNaseH-like and TPR domain